MEGAGFEDGFRGKVSTIYLFIEAILHSRATREYADSTKYNHKF